MSAERLHLPELQRKSVIEIISLLSTFPWYVDSVGRRIEAEIKALTIVDYDTNKPRTEADLYDQIPVTPGYPIKMDRISEVLAPKPGRTTGLTSLVWLDESRWQEGLSVGLNDPWVHLPLIDIDLALSDLSQAESLNLIRKEIEKTEITKGVIFASGQAHHYHFIGTERLLTEEQLPTFVGLCLTMKDQRGNPLVDPRWVGHALTPMKYMVELDQEGSVYDYRTRFATLRIAISERKPYLPTVVDVL